MSVVWKKTKHPGVRYYEHETRKHGIQKDKYFAIRYQRNKKRKEEGLGWASEGWTAGKAALELAELKKAHLTGNGATRLSEKRRIERNRRKAETAEKARQEKENIKFKDFFKNDYYPISKSNKKPESYRKEKEHCNNWLKPVLGKLSFKKIAPLHLERVKKNMLDSKLSPRSIQYVFATFRQIWNMARRDRLVDTESPTKQVKLPKISNERLRFLTHSEADTLLSNLKARSTQLHNMALLSLHCGCRAGEIFALKQRDVDLERGTLTLWNTKNTKTRTAYLTDETKEMLSGLKQDKSDDLVFPDRKGKRAKMISNVFADTVRELDLNKGVTDPKQKVVFHSLRHTFASWHIEAGTDLYTLQKLLGHSSIAMVQRYSHLTEGALQEATRKMEASLSKPKEDTNVVALNGTSK